MFWRIRLLSSEYGCCMNLESWTANDFNVPNVTGDGVDGGVNNLKTVWVNFGSGALDRPPRQGSGSLILHNFLQNVRDHGDIEVKTITWRLRYWQQSWGIWFLKAKENIQSFEMWVTCWDPPLDESQAEMTRLQKSRWMSSRAFGPHLKLKLLQVIHLL